MADIISQLQSLETQRRKALASLHSALGYSSPQSLADAILAAAGAVGSTNGKAKTGAAPAPVVGKRKPGMRVDDATRKAIEEALKAGTTGTSLANKYGLSYQTIHIMKQRLGLVKVTKASRRSKSK